MDAPQPLPDVSWSQTRFAGNGLRTRFRPSCRIRSFFLFLFPWIDALILSFCLVLALSKKAVTPGIQTNLASAPFSDDVHANVLLVAAPPATASGASLIGPLVFFNSHRYDIGSSPADFTQSLHAFLKQSAFTETNVVLFVDRDLSFDKLSDLLVLLRSSGIENVHFAAQSR